MAVVQDDAAAAAVELEPQGAAFVPLQALPAGGGRTGRAVPVSAGLREGGVRLAGRLRDRAARFEQHFGRAPSQRELARLAQASNFKTRNPKQGALDLAQAHADWADKLTHTLGVNMASIAPSVWHEATAQPRAAQPPLARP